MALISPDKVTELSFFHAVVPAFQRGITITWKPSSHVLKCISHCAIRVGSEGLCVRGGGCRLLPDGDSSGFSQSPPGSRFDGACLVSKCSFLSPPLGRAIVSKLVYICSLCFFVHARCPFKKRPTSNKSLFLFCWLIFSVFMNSWPPPWQRLRKC